MSTASALADTTQASLPADLNNAIDIKSTDVSSLPISISENIDSSTQDQCCSLPDFEPSSSSVFNWGSVDSDTFSHSLEASYSEVVHWRNNNFKIPSGNVGKKFVLELARLFRSAGEGSSLESIALKAAFTFCILVTQKPTRTSKSKDHICDRACENRACGHKLHHVTLQVISQCWNRIFVFCCLHHKAN